MKWVGMLVLAAAGMGLGFAGKSVALEGEGAGDKAWLYKGKVYYQEFRGHGRRDIYLQNGERLFVDMEWAAVENWRVGRPLLLAYSPATGTVLEDPGTGKLIPVLYGLKDHPIDILQRKESARAPNTIAAAMCYVKAEQLWDKELNRVYKLLLADKNPREFTREEKSGMVRAQRQWIKFRDAQLRAIATIFSKRPGTIQRVKRAGHAMELTRSQALRLSSYLVPRDSY